jgi:hypothetical protein
MIADERGGCEHEPCVPCHQYEQDRRITHNIAVVGRYLEKEFPGAYITDGSDEEDQCHIFTVITQEQGTSLTLVVGKSVIAHADLSPSVLYRLLVEHNISERMRKNQLYELGQA